jgi:hypothetical protein
MSLSFVGRTSSSACSIVLQNMASRTRTSGAVQEDRHTILSVSRDIGSPAADESATALERPNSCLEEKKREPKIRVADERASERGKLLCHDFLHQYRANFGEESSRTAGIFRATMRVAPKCGKQR